MRMALACVLLLAACGEPSDTAIDGSSAKAFDASLAQVRAPLGPLDRAKFEAGIKIAQANAFYKSPDRAAHDAKLREILDGMTAADVIREAGETGEYAAKRAAEGIEAAARDLPAEVQEFEAARREAN